MPTVEEMYLQADCLTRIQRRIFDHMLHKPEAVCYSTLKAISQQVGAAEVTVLNMCRRLGCSGYSEFQKAFRIFNGEQLKARYHTDYTLETTDLSSFREGDSPIAAMFDREERCLSSLAAQVSEKQIIDCARTLLNARTVLVYGHDASKMLADYLTHRLNYLRINASSFRLGDHGTVQTSLAMADPRDVVVLFSFPPYYNPVANVARYATYRGAAVVAVTDSEKAPVAAACTHHFICNTKTKFFFNTLTAPFSLINVLTSYIALQMGSSLDAILEEELNASRFMGGEFDEEGSEV